MNYSSDLPTNNSKLAATPQQRILSYLGELRRGDAVPVMRVANDLDIAYGTCAQHIRQLESIKYVVVDKTSVQSLVSLNPHIDPAVAAKVVCEWQDEFGSHPINGRTQRRTVLGA